VKAVCEQNFSSLGSKQREGFEYIALLKIAHREIAHREFTLLTKLPNTLNCPPAKLPTLPNRPTQPRPLGKEGDFSGADLAGRAIFKSAISYLVVWYGRQFRLGHFSVGDVVLGRRLVFPGI